MFSHFLALHNNRSSSATGGFSLIELLVSIGILVLVLTIVIANQGSFNSSVLLRSQAYEIALDIRETQLTSVSAKSDGTGQFRLKAGVYFDLGAPDRYMFFRDVGSPANGFYDSAEAFGSPGLLDPRFEIGEIRPSSDTLTSDNDVSILFERPDFDAIFFKDPGVLLTATSLEIDVVVKGQPGASSGVCGVDYRTIQITGTGQISVIECP